MLSALPANLIRVAAVEDKLAFRRGLQAILDLTQTYLRRIYEKLQVNSQAEAVAKFLR